MTEWDSEAVDRRLQHYLIARAAMPWNQKAHDDLEPEGETIAAVIDHWLACRGDIFDVGLGQVRYCLTDNDVSHLVEHVEKWMATR